MPTMDLPCELSEFEKITRAKEATGLVGEYAQKEEALKAYSAEKRAELKSLRARIDETSRAAREGIETRPVEVIEEPNLASFTMDTTRADNGKVISSRPMTAEETQRHRQTTLRLQHS